IETTPNVVVEGERADRARPATAMPRREDTLISLSRRPPPEAERPITNYRTLMTRIAAVPGVRATAPQLVGRALLRYGTRGQPVALTGILPRQQRRALAWEEHVRHAHGDLETSPAGAILGFELAKNLGIPVGARVTLIAAADRRRTARVVALYQSGIRQIDEQLVYVNLPLAQALLDAPSAVSQLAVRVAAVDEAPAVAAAIQDVTRLRARSWQEVSASFFAVFRLQNTMTSVMIAFIVVIAGFGIANGLITLVLEKQRDIGILKALGASARVIARIFLAEGLLMGIAGGLVGMGLAALAIEALSRVELRGEGELTTASTFTMLTTPPIYLLPAAIAILISALASLLPVRRAAAADPVTIIRGAK
ncbi:MAG TPA: ABC transporter permease, partial [Armatimonadota bacterium]|nr:ABC transporter permease [Armatimonadota bacterium]